MRNPSLSISIALEKRPKLLPLRATLDSINVKVFADNKQLQQIDNSNWQVLFGRRGAGKTTLLATYANYIGHQFDTTTRASIELNATDFLSVIDNATLDRSATRNIQPFFAELLKKVFWNNERFVVKIGAVRNQTKLSTKVRNSGPIGLELGADIFELNLDEVYTNPAMNKTKFYEELIFKHLSYCNPDLNEFRQAEDVDFYGTRLIRPMETFITYIFKSRQEFETLIGGAGGLPRDFVEIFDSLARARDFSVSPAWNMREVKSSIREHCVKNKQSDIRDDRDVFGVFAKIIALVQSNNSRIILVGRNSSRKLLNIVGEFYHKRLLHDIPVLSVPVLIRPRYYMYSVDLGLLYDANLVHMGDATESTDIFEFNRIDAPEKIRRYVLT
jgi:hypothetical protein